MAEEETVAKNLFCPYTSSCEVYQAQSANKAMRSRLDIINEYRGDYSCLAFMTASAMEDGLEIKPGQECSHIRLLNLLTKLQKH